MLIKELEFNQYVIYKRTDEAKNLEALCHKVNNHITSRGYTNRDSDYFLSLRMIAECYRYAENTTVRFGYHTIIKHIAWPYMMSFPEQEYFYQKFRSHTLLPQYPIDRFYVDFLDIDNKRVYEIDGAAYHDFSKDMKRGNIISRLGYSIRRIPASDVIDELNKSDY